jgi:hypothetical protein
LVQACGGSIISAGEGYQIVIEQQNIPFTPIAFSGVTNVNVQFNVTEIMDKTGRFIQPGEPGWVFLTDYNYNWGSIRDVLTAMGYEIKSFSDNPASAQTSVIIREIKKTEPGAKAFPTPSLYIGTNPIYIYYESDIKPSVSNNYRLINFQDPDYKGEMIWIHARDGIKEVRIYRVDYTDNYANFVFTVNKQLHSVQLTVNDILVLNSTIPEGIPHTAVTFVNNDGSTHSYLLGYNGRTGHINASKITLRGL